jgi:Tfp pilus assembly protein PilP
MREELKEELNNYMAEDTRVKGMLNRSAKLDQVVTAGNAKLQDMKIGISILN